MARILVESLMVRYPLAGMLSWTLQYLVGLQRLGHDVWLVERATHPWACFDPTAPRDRPPDPAYGALVVDELFRDVGLEGHWIFEDHEGRRYGPWADRLDELFRTADVFIAMTFEECWRAEASSVPCRIVLDGDPVFRQALDAGQRGAGKDLPDYDFCFTAGLNVGAADCRIPDDGRRWRPLPHPVATDLFRVTPPPERAAFTTIMNWRSYGTVDVDGRELGHKDRRFRKVLDLPAHAAAPMEVAVAGDAPRDELRRAGWCQRDAHVVTATFDGFRVYIRDSLGEFSVCKEAYVIACSGWFSDRSAAYLASGRPVVLEDTAFSKHLPTGEGLFAFSSADEALDAIERVCRDPQRHARRARDLAVEHLEATYVVGQLLAQVGL